MARVRNYGEMDWRELTFKKFSVSDEVMAVLLPNVTVGDSGLDLHFGLWLDPEMLRPAEMFQFELAWYNHQGFQNANVGDDEPVVAQECQLTLPTPLRSSISQLAVTWDIDKAGYEWLFPSLVGIYIVGYKEKIRYPSKFVAALARKLSRWANDNEVIVKRCLGWDEFHNCIDGFTDSVMQSQVEDHLRQCVPCSAFLKQIEQEYDAIDAMTDEAIEAVPEPSQERSRELALKALEIYSQRHPRQSFARRWWNERLEALAALKKRCRKPGRHQEEETQ